MLSALRGVCTAGNGTAMEAVIFIGLQACGKSSFYRARFFHSHLRINLDMLRTRHREARLLETCLDSGQAFVVDNTNPALQDRARYIGPARAAGFRVMGYYFQSSLPAALQRNRLREGEARIPDAGLRGTHAKMVLPHRAEGFDELFYVRFKDPADFLVEGWKNEV